MKLIDIKNLTFEYFRRDNEGNVEEMVEALQDVSLDVKQGEFIAILGQNGSGKSTLAKHINALLLPGEGEVIVDGMATSDEELRLHIRQTAGMVFQNPDNQIVANIVEEDVAFGPENMGVPTPDIWNRVDVGLNETEMQEYRQKSPNHLSGGQKQRVAIAGILAMEPKCIVFDEATAMLDPKGRMQMIQVAKKLQQEKGITIILITHHMDEVLEADKIFVMNKGKIAAQGSPKEIFSNVEMLDACGLTLPPVFQYRDFLIGENIVMKSEVEGVTNIEQLASVLLKDRINNFDNLNIKDDNQDVDILPGGMKESLTEGLFLDHVSYVYNRGLVEETYALKNVNISFSRGEFVAIIGHTGSGKSTLTQHLNGLILPTEGNIYFNGRDVTDSDFSIKELRQKVGYVFQYPEYQLFADTVENDVCFGPRNMNIPKVEAQKRAYEAIKMVGLPDTIYDCSPFQLSGGQKRRVAIAGVLAMNPEYIVLDEPTAGLDPKAALEILTLLKDLQVNKGITIVIVSHSMEEVAEFADRIVVIDQGEIQFDGPTCKVFQKREALQDMGLEIPVGISLLHILQNAGIPVDITKCRYCDICNELLKLKL
ncbi:MAG: energy-coupling factor transporter ATPase [Lachnospiraceae bacterium]